MPLFLLYKSYYMKRILVTGGSDGIGLEIARLLAAEGDRLTLVARNKEKLTKALESLPGTGHTAMTADLSKKDEVHIIADHLTEIHYDVLINSAGIGLYGRFDELPLSQQVAMMQLNMVGLTALSHFYLKSARPGDSLVNIASTLGSTSFPGLAVYSATKAFVLNFSESLWWENKKRGVYVLGFCPGVTATNFHQASGGSGSFFPRFITQTPAAVAKELIAALKKRKKPKAVSGAMNRSMLFFHRFLNKQAVVNMMGSFSPLHSQ
jgi:short-subunit dehydrogenase